MSEIELIPPADPRWSPSYPRRTHTRERAQWQALSTTWDERVAAAGQELANLGEGPARDSLTLTYHQMLGARDQIAEAVRRLPMEVGSMYEEDRHRVDEAVAALERLFQRWESSRTG